MIMIVKRRVFSCALAAATAFALTADVQAGQVAEYDGAWKAPDTTILIGADVFSGSQNEQPGPSISETVGDYWNAGPCTYDEYTGEPHDDCDRLRFGLGLHRGPDETAGYCPDAIDAPVAPQEDGGGLLTEDGEPYKVGGLHNDAGEKYCSDYQQRTLADSTLAYRDHQFGNVLGTNWPDRPQLTLHIIKHLPQTDAGTQDQVRDSLLAACELFEGNGNQHLSMPSWMLTVPSATSAVKLYSGMMAAAGGTGQCCYKSSNIDGSYNDCDPSADTIDMCAHIRAEDSNNAPVHSESRIRSEINAARYKCSGTDSLAAPGNMESRNFSGVKCHLSGASCDQVDDPGLLWPIFSCIQLRPNNIDPDNLSLEYCGSINGNSISGNYGDEDNDGCLTLTPGNGIEWVDDEQNMFYLSADSYTYVDENGDTVALSDNAEIDNDEFCRSQASGNAWTTITCPNQYMLCELDDGSNCSLGRYTCTNGVESCERYPGNDTCDSSACGAEEIHESGLVPPNAQFVVDRSGSMWIDDRWGTAKQVAMNLANWSYQGAGCEADGTNCDKVRLGTHFWSGGATMEQTAISVGEDTTSADMGAAFDNNEPQGATDFHHAARLLQNETALNDPDRTNVGVFVTDGVAEHGFTTREAARILCDLKKRDGAPLATYAIGFADGDQNLNSLIAAAGGTGTCCFTSDGICDVEYASNPCEMYRYEQENGQHIVDTFHQWIKDNRSSHHTEWHNLIDELDTETRTQDSYNTGNVADNLDIVDDVARWLIKQDEGFDPQHLDCENDPGDVNSTNGLEFYKWVLCETKQTLSYVVRHKYNGNIAEDISSWSDFDYVYSINHDSTFVAHDYVCTGSKFAGGGGDDGDEDDGGNDLQEELQAILEGIECSFPLSLLDGQDSAPEFSDATHITLYMPGYDAAVHVPHVDDTDGQLAFKDELCSLGVPNCENYADDGWSFATEGRTSVELSAELCSFSQSSSVEKVTTQVCRVCDPEQVGDACNWVKCTPDTIDGTNGYTNDGEYCTQVRHPCPDNPDETCTSWSKTGRCGLGEYACNQDNGLPYCKQVHSRLPEICNGVDDDCDGDVDDLRENLDEWADDQYDISDQPYDGWYCGYHDTCRCPNQQADSVGGYKSDSNEFQTMLEYQQANGECECGEGLSAEFEPTRTYAGEPTSQEPKAGCSSAGTGSAGGLATIAMGLLLGLVGLRRRRR